LIDSRARFRAKVQKAETPGGTPILPSTWTRRAA